VSRTKWDDSIAERAKALAAKQTITRGPAFQLPPLEGNYRFVELSLDAGARTGGLVVRAPDSVDSFDAKTEPWSLRAFRELDDALLRLRFDYPEINIVAVRTSGTAAHVQACDKSLHESSSGFAREVRLLQRRVLKRFDNTARSLYAVADAADSCFAGVLLELALGADRFYMLIDKDEKIGVATSVANTGFFTTSSGLSRLEARFYGEPGKVQKVLARGVEGVIPSEEAEQLGLATIAADDIDFEDELRIAIEERASLSPDALTGMEASLRFVGPETLETKIFGRLSAWQNWIFTRANSTGQHGALTLYGKPERPQFQWKRT
jgi:benzoyl-CoA-dihydrodiol lyase